MLASDSTHAIVVTTNKKYSYIMKMKMKFNFRGK